MGQYGDGFEEPQPEVCDLCGEVVGRGHLAYSMVEGLRGFAICDRHSFEAEARFQPSYRDLRARQAPFSPDPRMLTRQPPYGQGEFSRGFTEIQGLQHPLLLP
jgi:hypothetical protein